MLDALRTYLQEIPVLADMIQSEVHRSKHVATNTEEQRFFLEEVQTGLARRLKEEHQLYATMYFPEQETTCSVCKETLLGYYWELNNPVTGKAICNSWKVMHNFIHHEQSFITEVMENVTGVRVGEMRMTLDLPAIAGVMKGSSAPPEVMAEVEQAVAWQKQQLAEAGTLAASGGGH